MLFNRNEDSEDERADRDTAQKAKLKGVKHQRHLREKIKALRGDMSPGFRIGTCPNMWRS
jgi:hypothetical protein